MLSITDTLTARFNKIRSSGSTCKTVDKGSSKMIVTRPYVVPSKSVEKTTFVVDV